MRTTLLLTTSLLFACGATKAPDKKVDPKPTAACGDKTVNPGEQCDDGNTSPGDGCDAKCQTEAKPNTAPSTTATPTPPPATPGIAYDGRSNTKPAGIEARTTVSPELEKKILSQVAASYTTKSEGCKDEEAVIWLGNSATGSFTAAGKKEIAYMVRGEPCNASAAEMDSLASIVIFEGESPVALFKGEPFLGQSIENLLDMNQDGINELIVSYGGTGQGVTTSMARAYTFEDKKLASQDLSKEDVLVDECGTGEDSAQIIAAVISYQPVKKGEPFQFTSEKHTASCKSPTNFAK